MKIRRKQSKPGIYIAFIAPALLFYVVFKLVPLINGLAFSFSDWNGLSRNFEWIGFNNFKEILFDDAKFMHSVGFTLRYVIFTLILQNLIALSLAVVIESQAKGRGVYRTLLFLPNMISQIIGSFMWVFIFNQITMDLGKIQWLEFLDRSWLGDPNLAFFSILVVTLWSGVGYMMVIYIAALQGIPGEIDDASRIDGAMGFAKFRLITLPMIMHAITICLFLTLQKSFMAFDQVFALTGGGPGRATQVITLNIFDEAYSTNYRYGYASAKAIVLFLIIMLVTAIQLHITKKRELEI